jgi:8-oxo-dGTP diphosphatase
VVFDARGRVLLVRCSDGCFLPGGGLLAGESPEEGASREFLEETGLTISIGRELARAHEFLENAREGYIQKQSLFFTAKLREGDALCPEAGYEALWVDVDAAGTILSTESHRWALERARALAGARAPEEHGPSSES